MTVVIVSGAISQMALHFLEKYKIMVSKIMSKFELRRIARCVGARLIPQMVLKTCHFNLEFYCFENQVKIRISLNCLISLRKFQKHVFLIGIFLYINSKIEPINHFYLLNKQGQCTLEDLGSCAAVDVEEIGSHKMYVTLTLTLTLTL